MRDLPSPTTFHATALPATTVALNDLARYHRDRHARDHLAMTVPATTAIASPATTGRKPAASDREAAR